MKLSIIIINFRTPHESVDAAERLRKSAPKDTQIIIVENGSADDSLEVLRRDAGWATIVVSDTNLGFAGGCALAVAKAQGDYLAFINSDCFAQTGSLALLVSYLDANPDTAVVIPRLLESNGHVQNNAAKLPTPNSMIREYLLGRMVSWYDDIARWTEPTQVEAFSGASLVIRRDAYLKAGGFDRRYFMYVEDTELSYNLHHLGLKVMYIPGAVMTHTGGGSSASSRKWLAQMLERNRRDYVWRHFSPLAAVTTISAMQLGLGILALKHAIKSLTHRRNTGQE